MRPVNFWVILVLFAVVGFIIYSNALRVPFMMDDRMTLNDNHKNITHLWSSFHANPGDVYYRPLVNVSLKIMYYFFRDNTFGYHAVNLTLYVISAFCVFLLMRGVLAVSFLAAVLSGLFFLIHPINHILINYSSTTGFSLQTIFMLLSLTFSSESLPSLRKLPPGRGKRGSSTNLSTWLALIFFILAIFCHESSLILPGYVFVYLYFLRRESFIQSLLKTTPYLVVLFIFIFLRTKYARLDTGVLHNVNFFQMNFAEYLASYTKLVVWYLGQLFHPDGIVVIWATQVVRQGVMLWNAAFVALLGLLFFLALRIRTNPSSREAGLLWLSVGFLILAPACLVEPTRGLIVEPYWLVFASIGFCIWVAQSLDHVYLLNQTGRWVAIIAMAVIIVSWSLMTWHYNDLWRVPYRYLAFWQDKASDYSKVNCHFARTYHANNEYVLARHFYEQCLSKNSLPSLMEYHSNLGLIDFHEGKWEDAQKNFETALRLDPRSLSLYTHLGVIAFKGNDFDRAKKLFTYALRDQLAILPRLNMASIYKKENNFSAAIQMYEHVLSVDPRDDRALLGLMRLYVEQKNIAKIQETAKRIIKQSHNPNMVSNARTFAGQL